VREVRKKKPSIFGNTEQVMASLRQATQNPEPTPINKPKDLVGVDQFVRDKMELLKTNPVRDAILFQ